MDDDFGFGASVWDSSELATPTAKPLAAPPLISSAPSQAESMDDFDDFGTPAETVAGSGDEADDDFGDFGDFGEGENVEEFGSSTFDEGAFVEEPQPIAGPSRGVRALRLVPYPAREDLEADIENLLGPIWGDTPPDTTNDPPIRQATGLNQILITPERYFVPYNLPWNLVS